VSRTINFDNFRAEQEDEPVTLIIGKEEYALPSSLPASMAVDMMRMQEDFNDPDVEVPPSAMDRFGASLFGDTMWESLLRKHRITIVELPILMEMVFEAYSDEPPKEDPEATPESTSEAPASGSTSSPRGRGSRRTSSGSTEST
jgi:hypothetical protein